MEISELTLKLIIILIPGAISSIIVETLTIHKNKQWIPFRFVLNSMLLGIFSYLFLQLAVYFKYSITNVGEKTLKIWSTITNKGDIPYIEIIFSALTGLIIGFTITAIIQKKYLNKFAKRFRISQKFGDENLYSFFLNNEIVDWVYVRDKLNGLTYRGQVAAFSETETYTELLLYNVTVYLYETSEECYNLKQIYLKYNNRDIVIELP